MPSTFTLLSLLLCLNAAHVHPLRRNGDERTKYLKISTLSGHLRLPRNGISTIGDIRNSIEKAYGIPKFRLLSGSRELESDEVYDKDVHARMWCVVELRGGMHLNVETISGQSIQLEVSEKDTVMDVKKKLSEKQRIPVEQQRIIYEGKLLVDGKTLAEYNIKDNATIHLVLRLRGG